MSGKPVKVSKLNRKEDGVSSPSKPDSYGRGIHAKIMNEVECTCDIISGAFLLPE